MGGWVLRKVLSVLSAIAGWASALILLGYIAGQKLLPHFDPQFMPPGTEPHSLCYGWWMDIGSSYAVSCRASWLWPVAAWMNVSSALITYTLRWLMMALGRDLGGGRLDGFSLGSFLALGIFAVPTLLLLILGANYWIGVARRFVQTRKSSANG